MPWFVLYTKPRNEKKAAQLLSDRGITVYCPTHISLKQWSDRKKRVEEPLFRSYIFVQLEDYKKGHISVLQMPGAVRFLWTHGTPGIVRDSEIEAIKDFLGTYKEVNTLIRERIQPGSRVQVTSGPLRSQSGDLIRIQGGKAFLKLQSLGMELTAEVPAGALELV